MIKNKLQVVVSLLLLIIMVACDSGAVYKSYIEIPDGEWFIEEQKSFEFEIADNTKPLKVFYLVRNAVQYPFYNLYLKTSLQDSTGKELKGGMEELILFNQKTGKPKGDGLGDLFDQRVGASILENFPFPYNGKYTLTIQHNMRPDPLVGLLGIGVEIRDESVE